jgi:hypothetical protein
MVTTLLVCDAVQSGSSLLFRRNVLTPFSGSKFNPTKKKVVKDIVTHYQATTQ